MLSKYLKSFVKFFMHCLFFLLPFGQAPATDWYQLYNSKWPNGFSPGSTLAWNETYILRSYISMYRASKARNEPEAEQDKWLSRIFEHCDYIINSVGMEKEGKAYLVYAGHGFTPLARVVKLVFDDAKLYSLYKDKANQYLMYLEKKLVPFWRNYNFAETPFNWYLSYGSMLLYLHQAAGSKYYGNPYYQTPDTALKDYYLSAVSDMAENYFGDFQAWQYTGKGWNDSPYPQNKGLCYYPDTDSYLWRYFDYTGSLIFWGYVGETEYQGIETSSPLVLDKWYKIELNFGSDSLKMNIFDTDGTTLINRTQTKWIITGTKSDLIIGKRVDGNEFFNGVIDEVKLIKGNNTVALWKMEGNAADSSGNDIHGIVHGSPETAEGKIGKALRFKNGDYISVPNHSVFDSISRVELWVKFQELNTARYYILGRGEHFHYGPGGFHLFMDCYKRPEDVGHANLDIEFLVNAANDVHFNKYYPVKTLNRFCNTFTRNIWSNTDTNHPAFRSHIEPASDYGKPDYEEHTFRWLWLYQYEPFIGTLISKWYEAHLVNNSFSEAVANLACWQAGLRITDDEFNDIEVLPKYSQGGLEIVTYPNPASDYIFVTMNSGANQNHGLFGISIYNSLGVEIKKLSDLTGIGQIRIPVGELAAGVYNIVCNDTGQGKITKSFIVVK